MEIKPGMKIGIVGRTGAGKSTISMTLSRILELESGSIEIDDVDISKVGLRRLRDKITVIQQDPTLFKNTLRFNIDPKGILSDEQITKVIKKAGLDELLAKQL